MRVCVGFGGVLVGLFTVLVGRSGVLLGLGVLADFVVVSRLIMVMGGGLVVSRSLLVVFDGRVLLVCHERQLPEVVKVGIGCECPFGSLDPR